MILMQLNSDVLYKVTYLTGAADIAAQLTDARALEPFDDTIVAFLNAVSRELMNNREAKVYSDVMAFAFWIRKGSVMNLKAKFEQSGSFHLGKGVVFHIAPSNVPVNFAYSLVSGLLCGNANVVRVPSREFPQVGMITEAFNKVLECHNELKPYIICVRYDHDKNVNDLFSQIADMRVVWGGDQTIMELRKSPLPPRSGEITFADRYSLAVIDSDSYMEMKDKEKVSEDFYNDTFFSDQNACTSPRAIIWTGSKIDRAKEIFWNIEHELVEKKYPFQSIQGVNKLTQMYRVSTEHNVKMEDFKDNLIVRVSVSDITDDLMDYCENSGYFYEYSCADILEIVPLCNDKRCQTIAYIGNSKALLPLIQSRVKGIDRIVPMGKTMDFDLIWDGYDLPAYLTRTVAII